MPKKPIGKHAEPTNKKIAELEHKLEHEHEARLRLAADYANFQARAEQEKERVAQLATHKLLEHLFPVFDNFYRASYHAPEVNLENIPNLTEDDYKKIVSYFDGLRLIEKKMEETLEKIGLQRLPTQGLTFDPKLHEAISYEANTDVPADHIIDEVEAGWQIAGHVVKPAKVRVSQG